LSVVFEGESANLPPVAVDRLKDMAARLKGEEEMRIQLMAYAGGDDMQASKARRLSLSRALAVRTYLIENGVRSTRIDVRALGNKTTEEPVNRVDVIVAER
jgi:outer membrane protein OmpA-like peptidoglycan-associated protein